MWATGESGNWKMETGKWRTRMPVAQSGFEPSFDLPVSIFHFPVSIFYVSAGSVEIPEDSAEKMLC
jgi:hypothetical protein